MSTRPSLLPFREKRHQYLQLRVDLGDVFASDRDYSIWEADSKIIHVSFHIAETRPADE